MASNGQQRFVQQFSGLVEGGQVFAEQLYEILHAQQRPFASKAELQSSLIGLIDKLDEAGRLRLIRAHPELVGRLADEGRLEKASADEQKAAGLTALSDDERNQFKQYNVQYAERFGFPFVICARHNKKDAILAAFPVRLKNTVQQEIETAIQEIKKIVSLRVDALNNVDAEFLSQDSSAPKL